MSIYSIDVGDYRKWKEGFDAFSLSTLVTRQLMDLGYKKLVEKMRIENGYFDDAFYSYHGQGD